MTEHSGPPVRRVDEMIDGGGRLDLLGSAVPRRMLAETAMRAWGPEHDVAADDLAELLTGGGRRGIHLRGVRVVGRLVLDHLDDVPPLVLVDCLLDDGLSAECAHLSFLSLQRCLVAHGSGLDAPVHVSGARVDHDLELTGSAIHARHRVVEAVTLVGTTIAGNLTCRGATIVSESGPALNGDRCAVGGNTSLDGVTAFGAGDRGAVLLIGARITGQLILSHSEIGNESGSALVADYCEIRLGAMLGPGFVCRGAGEDGAVRFAGARITGPLNCGGAELVNESGPALLADSCEVVGSVSLERCTARGNGHLGTVRMPIARVVGVVSARGATLINDTGPAFDGDGAVVERDMILNQGFSAHGGGDSGTVRLAGAAVAGRLSFAAATVVNDSGLALVLTRCEVGQSLFLIEGFSAVGAVSLSGSRVAGHVTCRAARLSNPGGPALSAGRCEVGGNVLLVDGFEAHGAGDGAAVDLYGARVSGNLSCRTARIVSSTATGLDLTSAVVQGSVRLDQGFRAVSARNGVTVDLTDLRAGRLLVDSELGHASRPHRRWQLDGLVYGGLPQPDDRAWWLRLIRDGTPSYAAQPYQQLASVHRAAGHDADVRAILMAQRRDQVRRGRLSARERAWARFTGITLGYGWEPWRALYGLVAVFLVSVGLALLLGGHGALVRPPQPGRLPESCTVVERVGVGLDLGTPLIGSITRTRERCSINPDPAVTSAAALAVSTWALQLVGWGFAALFVAGFTGAVRRT